MTLIGSGRALFDLPNGRFDNITSAPLQPSAISSGAQYSEIEMTDWQTIDTAPEGVEVLTKIDDEKGVRNVQNLVMRTRIPGETRPLFWMPDGSMYVYYTPTHWLPASLPEGN